MAALAERRRISLKDGVTSGFQLDRKSFGIDNNLHASGQSDEVIGVGKRISFVEIIDTPAKPALSIPPCSETVYVQIADCENLRSAAKAVTHGWPQLSPPVESSS